jgi:hypothetical protein
LPATGQPALLWATVLRQTEDKEMVGFLDALGGAFQGYMERTMGLPFPEVELEGAQHRNLKFAGVSPRMPHIQVTDSPAKKEI